MTTINNRDSFFPTIIVPRLHNDGNVPFAEPLLIVLDSAVLFFYIASRDEERSIRITLGPSWIRKKVYVVILCKSPSEQPCHFHAKSSLARGCAFS